MQKRRLHHAEAAAAALVGQQQQTTAVSLSTHQLHAEPRTSAFHFEYPLRHTSGKIFASTVKAFASIAGCSRLLGTFQASPALPLVTASLATLRLHPVAVAESRTQRGLLPLTDSPAVKVAELWVRTLLVAWPRL